MFIVQLQFAYWPIYWNCVQRRNQGWVIGGYNPLPLPETMQDVVFKQGLNVIWNYVISPLKLFSGCATDCAEKQDTINAASTENAKLEKLIN